MKIVLNIAHETDIVRLREDCCRMRVDVEKS